MSLITRFAGQYNALSFNYGGGNTGAPDAIDVLQGNPNTGASTVFVAASFTVDQGANAFSPFVVGQTIQIGRGAALETVTLTGVGTPTLVGPEPSAYSISLSASFSFIHGYGDPVFSATYGLQEAINVAASNGGGNVIVDPSWYVAGGTATIIAAAAVLTSPVSSSGVTGQVRIADLASGATYSYGANSLTAVAAPSAATSATVASQVGVVGTWTAITEHVLFTYVTADGGESLASADYSFTATVNLAIGGSGPAASTGAVGYRVYIGANATTTCYLVPAIAANGTLIQTGAFACFKLGTPFSVATATVAAALIPVQSSAFPAGFQPSVPGLPGGNIVEGPFAVTGVVTAGTAIEGAIVQLPAGALNRVNKAIRVSIFGIYTPVSTATLVLSATIGSVYNTTETTIFTVTTAASSGTTAATFQIQFTVITAAPGATGTVECHGVTFAGLVTATANLGAVNIDTTQGASGSIDLTKQDYLRILINSGTANLTQSQIRRIVVEPLN